MQNSNNISTINVKKKQYTIYIDHKDNSIRYIIKNNKALDDTHFEPFVVESGGELGVRAQEIFKKICNLITQSTGRSGSSIAYVWKSRLLVTLVKITHSDALKLAMAHNDPRNPQYTNRLYRLLRRRHSREKADDTWQQKGMREQKRSGPN